MSRARGERRTRHIGDASAGLGHYQRPAGDIPRLEVAFPEPVHPSGRDVAQIDGRRSKPPDGARPPDERAEQADDLVHPIVHVVGKAGDEHRIHQIARGRHADWPAVEKRTGFPLRREQLVARGVVHGRDLGDTIDLERERRAEDRQPVRKVGRAVDRVEHPARTAGDRLVPAQFLGQHAVIRKTLGDELAEHPLDGEVDLGHQVDDALLVDPQVAAEPRHHGIAGAHDRLDGGDHQQGIARGGHEPSSGS